MKHQQVKVDYLQMLKVSAGCVFLAFLGWVLMRMVYAIFILPGYLEKSHERLEKHMERHMQQPSVESISEEKSEKPEAAESVESNISDGDAVAETKKIK